MEGDQRQQWGNIMARGQVELLNNEKQFRDRGPFRLVCSISFGKNRQRKNTQKLKTIDNNGKERPFNKFDYFYS